MSKEKIDSIKKICDLILEASFDANDHIIDIADCMNEWPDVRSLKKLSEINGYALSIKTILEILETGD